MLKKGDEVIIVGAGLVDDFTRGTILNIYYDLYEIQCNQRVVFLNETNIFKNTPFNLFLLKLFRRKEYAEYKRTHKKCDEV